MEFRKLEIKEDGSHVRRLFRSVQVRRTIVFAIIGAIGGFLFFYFTEGSRMDIIPAGDIIKSILIGGFFGIFIMNSPCARGRC